MKIDILKKITTTTIIGFASGVVFTIFFNMIVNKDPFKVDSDSISSLANIGTFVVALFAALQVKKWLDNKVNETGFKQSEKIIEKISEITLSLITIHGSLHMIDPRNLDCELNDNEIVNFHKQRLLTENENLSNLVAQLNMLAHTIHQWNVEISKDYDNKLESLIFKIIDINKSIRGIFIYSKDDEKKLFIYIDQINRKIDTTTIDIDVLMKNKVTNLFKHGVVTSPSKKVDQ